MKFNKTLPNKQSPSLLSSSSSSSSSSSANSLLDDSMSTEFSDTSSYSNFFPSHNISHPTSTHPYYIRYDSNRHFNKANNFCENCGKRIKNYNLKGNFCSKVCLFAKFNGSSQSNKIDLRSKHNPIFKNKKNQLTNKNHQSVRNLPKRFKSSNVYKFTDEKNTFSELKESLRIRKATNYFEQEYAANIRKTLKEYNLNENQNSAFDWVQYLSQTNSKPIPESFFENPYPTNKNGFRVGMMLEGVDPDNKSLICVLSVVQIQGFRLRLHFEGYDSCFDFWRNANSKYIFPVGYCKRNGLKLSKPKDYEDDVSFEWSSYLIGKVAAPKYLFNKNQVSLNERKLSELKIGMKLEAVDKYNPILIRVATIVDIVDKKNLVRINYDGWPSSYDIWIETNSEDIYPINWCKNTGHYLARPLSSYEILNKEFIGCQTNGCLGIGHVKGGKYTSHYSESGCPYSIKNLKKENQTNRLSAPRYALEENSNLVIKKEPRSDSYDQKIKHEKKSSNKNALIPAKTNQITSALKRGRPKKIIISKEPERSMTNNTIVSSKELNKSLKETLKFQNEIYESVYQTKSNQSIAFKYDSQLCKNFEQFFENTTRLKNVQLWTANEVSKFIAIIPGCNHFVQAFKNEQIDGEALMLIKQSDLIKLLKLKLGPAVKIYNYILRLKKFYQQNK